MKMRAVMAVVGLTALAGMVDQAAGIELTAGVTHSDVGLFDSRGGVVLGVGRNVLPGAGPVDLIVVAEYIQRAGAQPRYFASPSDGLVLDDAEVRLHYLQPAAFVGMKYPMRGFAPRLYAGLSVALKLSENWTQPDGDTNGEIGYQDTDFLGHVGLSLHFTQLFVDARYSFGFFDQLVDNTDPVVKAAENEDGLDAFEDGAKISGFQMSLGVTF